MIPTLIQYTQNPDYNQGGVNNYISVMSPLCESPISVNATSGCPDGGSCIVDYVGSCPFPDIAVYTDIAVSIFFLVAIIISKMISDLFLGEIDDSLQTSKDYSIVVTDPPSDAEDPDEWMIFFSRFGKVRAITVLRENYELLKILVEKHYKLRQLDQLRNLAINATALEKTDPSYLSGLCLIYNFDDNLLIPAFVINCQNSYILIMVGIEKEEGRLQAFLVKLEVQLKDQSQRNFRVKRLIVTFETEDFQTLCFNELEIPDFDAIIDNTANVSDRALFRGKHALNIRLPHEPNDYIWDNITKSDTFSTSSDLLGNILYSALMFGSYVAIDYVS